MKEPKFSIGDRVKFHTDGDEDAGEVMSFSFDSNGYSYKVSSKEVDIKAKIIIEGVKSCHESELVALEK